MGVDRQREFRLLRSLRDTGLAPRPRAITSRWLLLEWLPGETLDATGWRQVLEQGTLAARLAHLHRHRRYGYSLNLPAQFTRCWQASDPARRTPAWLRLQRHFLHAIPPAPLRLVPLHMDIHAGNLLQGRDGALAFIDWEYAADGDVALELAALFRGNGFTPAQQAQFIHHYLRHTPGLTAQRLRRQIAVWLPWVDYLMLMWYETRWRQTRDPAFTSLAAPLRRQFRLE